MNVWHSTIAHLHPPTFHWLFLLPNQTAGRNKSLIPGDGPWSFEKIQSGALVDRRWTECWSCACLANKNNIRLICEVKSLYPGKIILEKYKRNMHPFFFLCTTILEYFTCLRQPTSTTQVSVTFLWERGAPLGSKAAQFTTRATSCFSVEMLTVTVVIVFSLSSMLIT